MKKILSILLVLAMALSLVACGGASAPAATEAPAAAPAPAAPEAPAAPAATEAPAVDTSVITKVALVTDVGTIDDESFNQACWEGVEEWCKANGLEYTYYQPTEDSTDARVLSIAQAIAEGYNTIVMPGYLFGATLTIVMEEYPDVNFIAVDVAAGDLTVDYTTFYEPTANTACLTFSEEQAGYLAGYAAVKEGYTKLGFLGGMAVPAVIRYGYGFIQGADAAAKELNITVDMNYIYGGLFYGTADFTAVMDTWYQGGTEVVFACGGGIYTSAVDAAKKVEGAKVIGVDVDQAGVIANYAGMEDTSLTITSAMKGLYPTTVDTLTDVLLNGNWANYSGKVATLGLVSGDDPTLNYVQIPMESTQWSDTFTQDDYKALVKGMFDGTIVVSADISAMPATTNVNVTELGQIVG